MAIFAATAFVRGISGETTATFDSFTGRESEAINTQLTPTAISTSTPRTAETPISIGRELSDAKNYRAFVLSSLRRPKEGGYFYAMRAIGACGMGSIVSREHLNVSNRRQIRETATISAAQLAAQQRLLSRCQDFLPGEANQIYKDLWRRLKDHEDPVVDALGRMRSAFHASDHVAYKAAFTEVVNLGAMLALTDENSGTIDMVGANDIRHEGERWFDGVDQIAQGLLNQDEYALAVEFAVCDPDIACEVDERMLNSCAYEGLCAQSRQGFFDALNARHGRPPARVLRIVSLEGAMRDALKAGNVEVFFAPDF